MKQSSPPISCDSDRLRKLLTDELEESSQNRVVRHLDGCARCRNQLEEIAADENFWRETEALLQRDLQEHKAVKTAWDAMQQSSVDPRLRKNHRRVKRQRQSLQLLRPSSEPESLGRLGRYEIRGLIGCGGMGAVFHAIDPTLQRSVALKVLHSRSITKEAHLRFIREAQTVAALNNRYIVTVFEIAQDGEIPYIAMELVDGSSLQQYMARQNKMRFSMVVRVARQVAEALGAAHQAGIIHRDLKPSNIMLDKTSKRILLTDFGLACSTNRTMEEESDWLAGTPEYMSPEQARGDALSHSSDLFSLGTLLYTVCEYRSPFRGQTTRETLRNVIKEAPAPLPSGVPAWFSKGIYRLLEKDPKNRFASAVEFLNYLSANGNRSGDAAVVLTPLAAEPYIRFECPICGKRLKTLPTNSGGGVRCRRCLQLLRIPANAERVEVLSVDPTIATILKLHGRVRWKSGQVRQLDLRNTVVADQHLRMFGKMIHLDTLLLEGTIISDEGMVALRNLKSLRHLTLSMTAISDKGVAELVALPKLQTLTLAHCSITDSSIDSLRQFRKLRQLRLDGTLLSSEGVDRLQLALPDLQIWS